MQARSERTRRRLVHAGAEMFNRNGYANATLGQIAGAAGMTKGALYFHFASKDGLADAVQQQARAMLAGYVGELGRAGVPPVQALIDMTHWLARVLHEDPVIRASFRITNECTGRQPPVTDFHQEWISAVWQLLDQARTAGELRDHACPEPAQTLVAAAVCGIEVLAGTGMPYAELRRRVGALWELLLSPLVPAGNEQRYRTHLPAAGEQPQKQAADAGPPPVGHPSEMPAEPAPRAAAASSRGAAGIRQARPRTSADILTPPQVAMDAGRRPSTIPLPAGRDGNLGATHDR